MQTMHSKPELSHLLQEPKDPDTFRILLTTDTHLGHKEKDRIRGKDSFETFEEILFVGKQYHADFVLHGGDLFDEAKPSRNTLYETLRLLRKYCMGEGPISFEILSDPQNFKFGLNYLDPNVNISLPVFAIHGNHDYPGEEALLSALDLLEASNLINYFGRVENLEDIRVTPILLQKGNTKLAIYGFGWLRDERLHHAFQAEKVKFLIPEESDTKNWFNLMTIHQNRYKGVAGGMPRKNCIHEAMLPHFLDLVLWGHEHDCCVTPRESIKGDYHILQLGSSIPTSLSSGEALSKHIAMLEVKGDRFRVIPIPLQTLRPFVFQEVCLTEMHLKTTAEKDEVDKLLKQTEFVAHSSLDDTASLISSREKSDMDAFIRDCILRKSKLPLIRLRVEYTGYTAVNGPRFGAQFIDRVANPADILLFYKKKEKEKRSVRSGIPTLALEQSAIEQGVDIHDIIFHFLDEQNALDMLPEPDMNVAVQDYVVKMEPQVIHNFVNKTLQAAKETVLAECKSSIQDLSNPSTILSIIRKRTDSIRSIRLNESQGEALADELETQSSANLGKGVIENKESTFWKAIIVQSKERMQGNKKQFQNLPQHKKNTLFSPALSSLQSLSEESNDELNGEKVTSDQEEYDFPTARLRTQRKNAKNKAAPLKRTGKPRELLARPTKKSAVPNPIETILSQLR
ncbi:Mre11 Dna-binding domain-containing protein [Cardiosporidium cionae]|uniref:Double-strand break repair protein n=1 Tax=Cardiosporidium cionae TaxID=476202 RepID=A0ABQ7JFR7_9APIC|nr:Mre11 Dna-binding domain-containing protein [Cardiosporidium cionae]|eukprot:KAF8822838.1 Mre11 Dna-binding domain-containing protein [Cardiosporidium cionae]